MIRTLQQNIQLISSLKEACPFQGGAITHALIEASKLMSWIKEEGGSINL